MGAGFGAVSGAFRNYQVAAPLKPGAGRKFRVDDPTFRNYQVAAPLKPVIGIGNTTLEGPFRNYQVAAPLKRQGAPVPAGQWF